MLTCVNQQSLALTFERANPLTPTTPLPPPLHHPHHTTTRTPLNWLRTAYHQILSSDLLYAAHASDIAHLAFLVNHVLMKKERLPQQANILQRQIYDTRTHTHTHTHTYTHTYTHAHTHIHTRTHTHTHARAHTHTHTHIHARLLTAYIALARTKIASYTLHLRCSI